MAAAAAANVGQMRIVIKHSFKIKKINNSNDERGEFL